MSEEAMPWFVRDAREMLERMRTAHLATVNDDGTPHASVAPFLVHDGALWVFVSALAAHTGNLRRGAGASVLLARDEADSDELFARARLTLWCVAAEQPRDGALWVAVLDRLEARFGETAATVRGLPDFALFRLDARGGQVVSGFARARRLDGAEARSILGPAPGS